MVASADSTMAAPQARVEHVVRLLPDLCSLDVATMTFPSYAFVNIPQDITRMAELIQEAGVKPELGSSRQRYVSRHRIYGNLLQGIGNSEISSPQNEVDLRASI
jgi:uncharacterized protein (DUF849 family)